MENVLGIMGGMGPQATQLFYKMIVDNTQAACDQEHINVLILGHATMPDRTAAILSGEEEEIHERLLKDMKFLEQYGCKAIAIPCNTSHYFIEKLSHEISIPIINMVEESAAEAAKAARERMLASLSQADLFETGFPYEQIGILATDGTIKMGLYQKALEKSGADWYIPDEETQKLVMYEIYDRIKKGLPADMSTWLKIESAMKNAGCTQVLLACTELSVICEEEGLSDYYIDAMKVLTHRCIEFMGKQVGSHVSAEDLRWQQFNEFLQNERDW